MSFLFGPGFLTGGGSNLRGAYPYAESVLFHPLEGCMFDYEEDLPRYPLSDSLFVDRTYTDNGPAPDTQAAIRLQKLTSSVLKKGIYRDSRAAFPTVASEDASLDEQDYPFICGYQLFGRDTLADR